MRCDEMTEPPSLEGPTFALLVFLSDGMDDLWWWRRGVLRVVGGRELIGELISTIQRE